MNTISSFRKCNLSNVDLLKKVDQMTDQLFNIKDKVDRDRVLTRHIPARPNSDYDLLVGELLIRFNDAVKLLKEYEEWEADIIAEDKLWWPNRAKDVLRGPIYDKMMELQLNRNDLLKPESKTVSK